MNSAETRYIYCMTIKEAYIEQMKVCQSKGLHYDSGHYETTIRFNGKEVYVSSDGAEVVRYKFSITGCMKTRVIKKNGKVVKVLHFHKDKLPVYGTITKRKSLKGFLYKYLLFLRCDGIENRELLKLYTLKCLTDKFEFWRKKPVRVHGTGGEIETKYEDWELYDPGYSDVAKMIEGLIQSALKKQIDNDTKEQFTVRTCCVVNPEVRNENGGIRKKTNGEKRRDAKRGQRVSTDNRIKSRYDPALTDHENAEKMGISIRRLQEWKADNRDTLESIEQRINRLYDWTLSPKKNAEIIGCCVNTIKKYIGKIKAAPVVEETIDETEDSWIDQALEDEYSFWKDEPTAKQKNSDDYNEFMELLDNLLDDLE